MHPLRFPNSGIRAKVFVRKISFKLSVMRLNRVELFYTLVVAIGTDSRRCVWGRDDHMHAVCMQRWLAMARPPTGAASHTRKGRPPAGTVGSGQPVRGCCSRPAYRQQVRDAGRRVGRPLAAWLPAVKGSRRLRKGNGSDSGGAVRVKEG
ncbi:hypothetical protein GW17_00053724 [Ensete ventricosum]|nr:hypothetical protein GW17_00053724 [Ensete ventricosum]RZS29189.1 hypothetical protein BHM03_00062888 [Ensete ventricosum]